MEGSVCGGVGDVHGDGAACQAGVVVENVGRRAQGAGGWPRALPTFGGTGHTDRPTGIVGARTACDAGALMQEVHSTAFDTLRRRINAPIACTSARRAHSLVADHRPCALGHAGVVDGEEEAGDAFCAGC